MKNNKTNILMIIVFLSIITLPQIIFWFVKGETTDISTAENRKLNEKPELAFATILNYPQNFENYYNDHLPFRTELKKIWTHLNYELFNTTVDSRVLIGEDGWLFYRDDQSIEQTQGILRCTEQEKKNILLNLQNNVDKLKEKEIDLYILILPNKENIYRDKLPNNIPIKNDITNAEDLINYIKNNSDINIIYPKKELIDAKEKYQVYRKYDTHWNKIGAFIGTISLQKAIDSEFFYNLNEINIEVTNEKKSNDLANFAGLNEKLFENVVRVKEFYSEVEYIGVVKDKYEEYISNSKNDKVVLFIGDSFSSDMKEYFSKLYKRVIYIHRDKYNKEVIEEIKPNIIVFETVERFYYTINKQLL